MMRCRGLGGRLLMALSVLVLAACGEGIAPDAEEGLMSTPVSPQSVGTRPQGLASSNKVLILSGTVTGGTNSIEAISARNLGYTVEFATDDQWKAKTSADFATYRALILGDRTCSTARTLLAAAEQSTAKWGPVVDGNVVIMGTDPVYHEEDQVTINSVKFAAAQAGKTGMYVNLSCYYHETAPLTAVPVLAPFGNFTVTGVGCYNTAHIVATHAALTGLTDSILSNWNCSVHEAFDTYPEANFTPLVIARDPTYGARLPGSKDFADGSHGVPYVLARGAVPLRCGDGVVQYPEECDTGSQNGVPGTVCSSVCRKNWCGDGVVNPGEECDTGAANGTGTCSASCRSTGPTNRPPVAKCKNIDLSLNATCGATGSINDGSYDPDNNLKECVQSPTSFTGAGSTTATLTCTDTAGLSASCTATVKTADVTPPTVRCPENVRLDCVNAGRWYSPGPASYSDNCKVVSSTAAPPTTHLGVGTHTFTYSASDGTQSASCNTTVTIYRNNVDVELSGAPEVTLACGAPYVEMGAGGFDSCSAGPIPVTVSGAVNNKVPGVYFITYTGRDMGGYVSTVTRKVTVTPSAACGLDEPKGGWILTGSMALPRLQHTATLLDDGRVLVAGGYNTSSELYEQGTKVWTATGNTLGAHRGHTATKLQNGQVLIAGGGACPITSASAELYVPAQGKWKPAGLLRTQRFNHSAVLLPNGKVLVAGGFTSEFYGTALSSAELYDPATGTWSYTGALSQARGYHTLTLLPNGKVLVTGGSNVAEDNAENPNLLASAELYDPATGTWSSAGGLSTGRAWHSATLLPNGQVLVAGGAGIDVAKSQSAELYNPATGTWTTTGSMKSPRRWHTATLMESGEVLVAGGYHQLTGIQVASERYNPATGKWTATVNMNVDRYRHTATLLPNGTVLAVGGASNHDQASAEYYDLRKL
ncbi:kelch repeat-containing protein [Archangium primigenium]|uniref:kelch repeat-containing protein n=1 Tax=[Archangium] primigenium TaxID=2792470 RepID=UPI001EF884E0|nr:kelch repeat-containing protein [Archangium primigenium]